MKKALVCGAGGFIGGHLVKRLKHDGYYVVGADLKLPEYQTEFSNLFEKCDLRDVSTVNELIEEYRPDEIYQLAADMGGAGYIFTGEHDADVMHNSAQINLNFCHVLAHKEWKGTIFYSSSACMYPQDIQDTPNNIGLSEELAYPANPDSEYGWEKLFSERLYLAYHRNYGLKVRIARFHNIFGPQGTWKGGKEKAPAAICRKVASAGDGDEIEIWGDGNQTRSFLYIDECIDGVLKLMNSNCIDPLNIGSDEIISINDLTKMVCEISGKNTLFIKHIPGPQGVRGRNSDNTMIREKLGWTPSQPLRIGMEKLYAWVEQQVKQSKEVVW